MEDRQLFWPESVRSDTFKIMTKSQKETNLYYFLLVLEMFQKTRPSYLRQCANLPAQICVNLKILERIFVPFPGISFQH